MDGLLDEINDRDAQIARQLPVISAQRDSLAAVMLTRWLRLAVAHGPASLEVTRQHIHTGGSNVKTLQQHTTSVVHQRLCVLIRYWLAGVCGLILAR